MAFKKYLTITTVLSGGLCALPVMAADDFPEYVTELTTPENQADLGLGASIGRTGFAGVYNGKNELPAYPLAGGIYQKRNVETGEWWLVKGSNLGLSTREITGSYRIQGDFGVSLGYSGLTKENPYVIRSTLTGIGSNNQNINGTSLREIELQLDRHKLTLAGDKTVDNNWAIKFNHFSEKKEGNRQFGQGSFGGTGISFLVDPVEYMHHESTGKVVYTGKDLRLTAGARASFFENQFDRLVNDSGVGTSSLPPSNQMYQAFLNGSYDIAEMTHASFQFSYSQQLQDEKFFATNLAPGISNSLDGRVHNYVGAVDLRHRVNRDLVLSSKVRYESRHEETPTRQYLTATSNTNNGFNPQFNRDTFTADLEGKYRLPMDINLRAGMDYEFWQRGFPTRRQASWRRETHEGGANLRLAKQLSDAVAGQVKYRFSTRTGSGYEEAANGTAENTVNPIHWSDRKQHKTSGVVDWSPSQDMAVQFELGGTLEDYQGLRLGPSRGYSYFVRANASYQLNRDWMVSGWISQTESLIEQATDVDDNDEWQAELTNVGFAAGLGVKGMIGYDWKIGGDLLYSYDAHEYELDRSVSNPLDDLPETVNRITKLSLWGDYMLDERSTLKLGYDVTYQLLDDWSWEGFAYKNGTATVLIPDQQLAHFLGVTYRRTW